MAKGSGKSLGAEHDPLTFELHDLGLLKFPLISLLMKIIVPAFMWLVVFPRLLVMQGFVSRISCM